jgi:hypothetical protein
MPLPDQLAGALRHSHTAPEADRRQFIRGVGMAVLTVHCLPLAACVEGPSSGERDAAPDSLKIASGPGKFGHVHDLAIPFALLSAPPAEGVALSTSKAFLHRHDLRLSQAELALVHGGGTVTQRASSHVFVIALTRA